MWPISLAFIGTLQMPDDDDDDELMMTMIYLSVNVFPSTAFRGAHPVWHPEPAASRN